MANEVEHPQPEEGDPTDGSPPTRPFRRRDSSDMPASDPVADAGSDVVPGGRADVDLFPGLRAPQPSAPDPGTPPRVLAFASILLGGLLGGLIGYGIGDLLWSTRFPVAALTLIGALVGAVGVGVLANLTLRAMSEWNAVEHPEADR